MHLSLVGQPSIALDILLTVAKEALGLSLLSKLDGRHIPASDLEKVLVALAGFQSGEPESSVPKHLLIFVQLSWVAIADIDDLTQALNWLPAAKRIVVPTDKRGYVGAWIETQLAESIDAVEDMSRYGRNDRPFFESMRSQLEVHGLLGLGKATPVSDRKLLTR
jgi:hypothetical protein